MNLETPLAYHRMGLMPIPVSGKKSLESWKDYQEILAPESVVRDWFIKHDNAGVAILTGAVSKILVLDLDGPEAIEKVKKYPFPPTWIAKTKKGYHYYFKWDNNIDVSTTIVALNGMKGVDVRGRGGYVVAPPSYDDYMWLNGYTPWEVELAPIPTWFSSLISQHQKKGVESAEVHQESWLSDLLEGVGRGERHAGLVKLASYYLSRMPIDVAEKLLIEWNEKNDPPMDTTELVSTIKDIASRYKSGQYSSSYQQQVVEEKPLLPINVSHFLDTDTPKIDWLVSNMIPKETITILGGAPKVGKSWLLLDIAIEMAKGGGKWMDYLPVEGGTVLYFDEESSEGLLRYRLKKLTAGKGINSTAFANRLHFFVGSGLCLDNPQSAAELSQIIKTFKPSLVIIDSLIRVHNREENSASDMKKFFRTIKQLRDEHKTSFLFADHEGKYDFKNPDKRGEHRLRGTNEKSAFVDTLISMKKDQNHSVLEHAQARFAKPVPSFAISIDDVSDHATLVRCLGYVGE